MRRPNQKVANNKHALFAIFSFLPKKKKNAPSRRDLFLCAFGGILASSKRRVCVFCAW